MLETSDIYDPETKTYKQFYLDANGDVQPATVEMTMTCTDYKLFREHYDVTEFEMLDGCVFASVSGVFDEYIDKYKKIKMESKGAIRTLAKLFLNNLYGKLASTTDSSFKIIKLNEDDIISFTEIEEHEKKAGYIPCGSAITSYARNFTIRAAQKNYYGVNKAGFIYADTDSIHCDLQPEQMKGIKVDDNAFCCWKLESCWDTAYFTRQKTYIERVTHEDLQPIEKPYYNIKCAGMPDKCKKLLDLSLRGVTRETATDKEKELFDKMNLKEELFVQQKRELTDFTQGLIVPGKLMPKRIKGGVVLVETDYEMR